MHEHSLDNSKTRPAVQGETLVTSTRGFVSPAEPDVAVCLLPSTEIVFEKAARYSGFWFWGRAVGDRCARFARLDSDQAGNRHRDVLLFANGRIVQPTCLLPRQRAVVVRVPKELSWFSKPQHARPLAPASVDPYCETWDAGHYA